MERSYSQLRASPEITRRITPEELAELHLEQGYVERALHIYEELVEREPANATYAMRRAWLARMIPPSRPEVRRTAPVERRAIVRVR